MKTIKIAIVTLPAFNELDSLIALSLLNRAEGVTAFLAGPESEAVSMNGVPVRIDGAMDQIASADAVIVGSGLRTRDFATDAAFLADLKLDPTRQLVASQCSGALILGKLGLLDGLPVCTDNITRPWIEELGLTVAGEALSVSGNIATSGGCLASQYLATWLLLRLRGEAETRRVLAYVVPVDEAGAYSDRLIERAKAADPGALAAPTTFARAGE
ncbi:MAG: DJ-1/PfpI family protein [Kiloniellaceae bacterium]